ncbi:DNA polymerase kappa [Coprinopsis sp. MPI-PUGE-AT-0042]|nr:DNA polymerase kappa [Coprinopsis sp. MPI-PUGE-AT-0042]
MSLHEPPVASQQSESLVRRLAGASVNKAGITRDKDEIAAIIAKASVGSKFYENEKKRDKELTAKIDKLLQRRDELLRAADIDKLEQTCDLMISKLEAERDLSQYIVHVDMDAFFANVEERRDPTLKGKPFVVGGSVVSTASYEARKYGVRSGMAGFIAKALCPQLIYVKSHYDLYNEVSSKIMSIFRRYDPAMAPAGCDEGYLNMTAYCKDTGKDIEQAVAEMRQVVFEETQLTVSAGIAANKTLAKICSDKNKPNGQFMLDFDPDTIKAFMNDLSIRKVPGIGRVGERLLESMGVKTCGDIYAQRAILRLMDSEAHLHLDHLLQTYLGIASNRVEAWSREDRKSIGAERTFSDLDSESSDLKKGRPAIFAKLQEIADQLAAEMEEDGWVGKTITLKYKLDEFAVRSRSKSVGTWVSKQETLFEVGKELLVAGFPMKIRLLGLRVTKLKDLRAEPANAGIKRFFQPVKQSGDETSEEVHRPRKRGKLGPVDGGLRDDNREISVDALSIYDGENDELEQEGFLLLDDNDAETEGSMLRQGFERPSHIETVSSGSSSGPRPTSAGSAIAPSKDEQATSTPQRPEQVSADLLETEALHCPICSKKIQTTNQGLNEHIDFCLSRGAIREAQASVDTSVPAKKDRKDTSGGPSHKPPSSKGKQNGKKGASSSGLLQWAKKEPARKAS